MAGTIRAKLDGYIDGTGVTNRYIVNAFKFFWDHLKELETLGIVTEIARNNGNTKGVSDTGWWFESNTFGENAWAVFRWEANANRSWEWYMLIQGVVNANNNVGFPGLLENSTTADGIGMAMAISINTGSGVTSNPWAGAVGSLGTDTKGDPVWVTGSVGDTLFVVPRSNSLSGSHTASRQNLLQAQGSPATNYRVHIISDDDGFVVLYGTSTTQTDYSEYATTLAMPYTPSLIVSSSILAPFVVINSKVTDTNGVFDRTVGLASLAGTAGRNGGIIAADMICTRIPRIDFIRQSLSTTATKAPDYKEEIWNHIPGSEEGTQNILLDLALFVHNGESVYQGYVGLLDSNLIKAVRFVHPALQTSNKDKIIFANSDDWIPDQNRTVYAVPWTGSVDLGKNYEFFTPEGTFSGSIG